MPASNVCWGIEIGAHAIKALKLELAGETIRVVDFAVVPHKKVLSTPGIDQSDVLRVSLGELVSQFDFHGASVSMSVPGHSAFARFAKLPPVEPKKIPDIVKFEAVQQIPFPIDQVEWDYQTFMSPDSPDVEVGIFAITRERIMERLALYEDVGIIPDSVTLSPVAAYNALAYDLAFTEKTPGTIILDIGTTSTDLIIAEAGRVWIRTFPIGGHHFTEALVNSFQLSYPKAEKFKREAESSKHARHIFQAMRPVFSDLAQDVQRSIGYYQSLHKDAKLERLVGLGSTFRLPGLRKYLKQQLQIDVFRMEQFKRIGVDGPRAGEFQAQTLNMATAYGLGLQGLGMATLEANLMPVAVVKDAMWKRKARWFGVAAAIAVAAGAAMFIRPFLDDQAVSANPPDPVINDTIQTAQRLKHEAEDVIVGGTPNTAAADVMGLLDGRDVIPRIEGDMRQMLATAAGQAPAKDKPAFQVKEFRTDFRPPSAADASGANPPPPPPANAAPVGEGGAPPATGPAPNTLGKVHVTLVVSTPQPEAQRFALKSLTEWLGKNAKRPDVPYEIEFDSSPVRMTKSEAASAAPAANLPAPASAPQTGGRGLAPLARGGRSASDVPIILGGGGPSPNAPGAPISAPTGPSDAAATAAQQGVRQIAPITPPAPADTPATSTFTVTWDAVLLPKPAQAGGTS
jgi:type IV pilus assembly protein PilM